MERQGQPEPAPEGRRSLLSVLTAFALPASFLVVDLAILLYGNYRIGFDSALYSRSAQALLAGQDPWAVAPEGGVIAIAAPPSSILPYTLTAWLPTDVASLVWVAICLAGAVWAVWRLHLNPTWLLFPPLFVGIWIGSLDALLPAAFLAAPALAPFLKIYAALGLIAERKWRSLILAGALTAPTLLLVPQWLSHNPGAIVASQGANLSAWGNPILLVLTVPALVSLGWRRGWYYAVPALWPSSQLHYAAMTLPAIKPIAAAAWCTPIGIIAEAVVERLRPILSRRRSGRDAT